MFDFEFRKDLCVGRVGLEMSLKPFRQLDDEFIRKVCTELFDQYRDLIRRATSVAVMLWAADGSDILEYSGDLDQNMQWCRYVGNPNMKPEDETPADPDKIGLHARSRLYMEDPPLMTYRDLGRIITALKDIGGAMTGLPVEVGATFDPGPEFAVSDFKYRRHREIIKGETMGKGTWCHCAARLHGDDRRYAAFPGGIPEGTHLGQFLGAQFRSLAADVGYDYIWLSNGFGYSLDSWSWHGECFDGTKFEPDKAARVREAILEFWETLTAACPGVRIETRGSNLSTATDIAAHGSPLRDIYDRYPMTAPPNSPWAALNDNFALELTGYMSHMAYLPERGYLFRYYPHDPWWMNSPWFDRYGQNPHDIYLPMAVTRLDEKGRTTPPLGINLLTVDDSFGHLPRRCPIEMIPHILNAYEDYPDDAAPVTWLYPFEQYHRMGFAEGRSSEVFFGDWFINLALEDGFPLNCVVSDTHMTGLTPALAGKTVVVTLVPDAGSAIEEKIFAMLEQGFDVLLYGPAGRASDRMRALMGVAAAPAVDGDMNLDSRYVPDRVRDGSLPALLRHDALLSGGGIDTAVTDESLLRAAVTKNGARRAYATFNTHALNGRLAWLRGGLSPSQEGPNSRMPRTIDREAEFFSASLMRSALAEFGLAIQFEVEAPDCKRPIILTSRRQGALFITGFAPDTTTRATLLYPDGAPIMHWSDAVVDARGAHYTLPKWWHRECRVFVRQRERSVVSCRTRSEVLPGVDRRIALDGLKDAEVIFYTKPGTRVMADQAKGSDLMLAREPYEVLDGGNKIRLSHITGHLEIGWGEEPPEYLR